MNLSDILNNANQAILGNFFAISVSHYVTLSSLLFAIGLFGVLFNRKNIITLLMSIEIMLLAVNVNLVAFSHYWQNLTGQVLVVFTLTVAAAEAAIGLAILVVFFRLRAHINLSDANQLKG